MSVSVVCSSYVCPDYVVVSFEAAEWPPFDEEQLTRLTLCSHCIMSTYLYFSHFPVWF